MSSIDQTSNHLELTGCQGGGSGSGNPTPVDPSLSPVLNPSESVQATVPPDGPATGPRSGHGSDSGSQPAVNPSRGVQEIVAQHGGNSGDVQQHNVLRHDSSQVVVQDSVLHRRHEPVPPVGSFYCNSASRLIASDQGMEGGRGSRGDRGTQDGREMENINEAENDDNVEFESHIVHLMALNAAINLGLGLPSVSSFSFHSIGNSSVPDMFNIFYSSLSFLAILSVLFVAIMVFFKVGRRYPRHRAILDIYLSLILKSAYVMTALSIVIRAFLLWSYSCFYS